MSDYGKSTFKDVAGGWFTKDGKKIRFTVKEEIPAGAKLLLSKNKFKTDSEDDRQKPDYQLTRIIEDEQGN